MITFTVEHNFYCDDCGAPAHKKHHYYEGMIQLVVGLPEGWNRLNDRIFCPKHPIHVQSYSLREGATQRCL